jgi:drug/metabolite transporter (DMT)-like permease
MTSSPARQRARAGVLFMVAATLLWGGTFVVTRDALDAVRPVSLIAGRFAVAGALLGLLVLLARRPVGRDALWTGLASAPLVAAGYALQATGLTETSAGSSAFLTAAGTLTVAPLAWLFLGERPSRVVAWGLALALIGSALLSWRSGLRFGRAELITLAGAVAYAGSLVVVAARVQRVDPIALTALQSLGVAIVLLPFASVLPGPALLRGPVAPRFLYLALAGSLAAPLLLVLAQRRLTSARIGILFALEPVFALTFALAFGAERFAARWWVGALIILSAVVLVELRPSDPGPVAPPTRS